jgi:hypothetical protein
VHINDHTRPMTTEKTDERPLEPPGAPRRKADTVTRLIGEETLVVPIRGHLADLQRVFSLNTVGAFVWERMDGTRDARELSVAVTGAFDVEIDVAEKTVRSFLKELEEAGLLEPGGS